MPGARDPLYQVSELPTMGGELWASWPRLVHTADAEEIHVGCGAEAQLGPYTGQNRLSANTRSEMEASIEKSKLRRP